MLKHRDVQSKRAVVNNFGTFRRARGFVLHRLLS